jgi:WD40 repeat protein
MRFFAALLTSLMFSSAIFAQDNEPGLVISVGHSAAPEHAAFIGNYLATAAWSDVAIIDLSSGLTVSHLPQGSMVEEIEANPAGDLMAVGTCGHAIKLWNVRSRKLVRRIALPQECAESVSFSPDGALLATGAYGCGCCTAGCSISSNGLQVWDVHSGTLVRHLAKGSGIRHVVFSGDGRWVAGVDDRGKAHVLQWPSGREVRTFSGLGGVGCTKSAIIASHNGRYIAWLGDGLRMWDIASGAELPLTGARPVEVITDYGTPTEARRSKKEVSAFIAEFLDDGRFAYVDNERQLAVIEIPDGRRQVTPLPKPARWSENLQEEWLRIRRDGLQVAGAHGPRIVLWDTRAARVRDLTSPLLVWPGQLEWSSPGIISSYDNEVERPLWNDRSGERVSTPTSIDHFAGIRSHLKFWHLESTTGIEHAASSPDGQWEAAALGGAHTALRVWPAIGLGDFVTLDADTVTYGPQPPAFSSDSQWLASFRKGKSLIIWSTRSWKVRMSYLLQGTGRALAFAPKGARLAVAVDGEAAVWDVRAGRKLMVFSSPGSARIEGITWSPDGRRIVTLADDGILRFWNVSDHRLLASLYLPDPGDDWLIVTPDGRLDGTEPAIRDLIAWRIGNRVNKDTALTSKHRVPGLWRSVSAALPASANKNQN